MPEPVLSLTAAWFVGLASTLHCAGMCGGIVGALSLSLPAAVRADRLRFIGFVLAYNAGRLASYVVAGALAGAVGAALGAGLALEPAQGALRLLAAIMLACIGLSIAGWLPPVAAIERFGQPLWRRLEPLGRRLLPVRSWPEALAFGAVWGWLPCGLVYYMLALAAAAGGALSGAATMLAFGAGTLPVMLLSGLLAGGLARLGGVPRLRRVAGLTLVVLGVLTAWLPPDLLHGIS